MRRATTIATVVILAIGLAGMASVAAAADQQEREGNETQPGEALSGALGVTDAEIQGEIAERGFGIQIAQAASNDSKADIVGDQLASVEQRLDEIEQRKADLEAAREAGEISEGRYKAEMATLETERATAERLANQSANTTEELPADILDANGISIDHIHTLRDRAENMTGPEVAEIAQQIAGNSATEPLPDEAVDRVPDDPGPPEHPGADDGDEEEQSDDETGGSDEMTDDDGSAADGSQDAADSGQEQADN